MRLKKGFTLAEILIVLMVIGVIAMMTIPSMMKGVNEAQLKTGYKKAYNTITNFAAMEKVAGSLPSRGTDTNIQALFAALNSNLSVKGYATSKISGADITSSGVQYKSCAKLNEKDQIGTCQDTETPDTLKIIDNSNGGVPAGDATVWIITEDNIAYTVVQGGRKVAGAAGQNADSKQQIAGKVDDKKASAASSAIIIVDVNGLSKGPNTFEEQGIGEGNALDASKLMDTIANDQFKIYIGADGATAGPRMSTVTGRMAADIK